MGNCLHWFACCGILFIRGCGSPLVSAFSGRRFQPVTTMMSLQITNTYPTKALPIFGIFVKEQIESLADLGILNDIFSLTAVKRDGSNI